MSPKGSKRQVATTNGDKLPHKQAKYSDGAMKSQCKHFFGRLAKGEVKKATEAEVGEAKEAVSTFDRLGHEDQTEFAKAFFSNKGNKTFGFIKDYTEKIKHAKTSTEEILENYFTRIAVLNVKNIWGLPSLIPSTSTPPLLSQHMGFSLIYLYVYTDMLLPVFFVIWSWLNSIWIEIQPPSAGIVC